MKMNDLAELLERAYIDEGEGIAYYNDVLNSIPLGQYPQVVKVINKIIRDEEEHLALLAHLADLMKRFKGV